MVQVVVLGRPALHLLIGPQVAFDPFAEQAVPVLVPVVQAPALSQSVAVAQTVVLGFPAEHVPLTLQATSDAQAAPSFPAFWHSFPQSATVVQLPPLELAYRQVPLFGTSGQLAELAPTAQPVTPVVVAQLLAVPLQSVFAVHTPLGTPALVW